jgi:hypothetical protein
MDISTSFQSKKSKEMLKGINLLEYTFQDEHLVYTHLMTRE